MQKNAKTDASQCLFWIPIATPRVQKYFYAIHWERTVEAILRIKGYTLTISNDVEYYVDACKLCDIC